MASRPLARAARAALVGAAAVTAALCTQASELPAMPGPYPTGARRAERDAATENSRCEGCHEDIAAEWRGSLHRRSHTEPAYARAVEREPIPFCQGCHAPEADAKKPVPEALGDMGTGCVTCHLTGDAVLAAPASRSSFAARSAPHAVARDARFGGPSACAACHEFDFPELGVRRPREPMQSTLSEHRASPFASFACADCHMPLENGHRSHRFAASRSPEVIRRAASVRATRLSPTMIRVALTAADVGHAFPTGDLFRRLTVVAEADGAPRVERRLMRRFGVIRHGFAGSRTQIGDDRVGVGGAERAVDLDLGPAAAGLPVRYRVDYERVEHPISKDGEEALVEGAITVAEGILNAEEDLR